MEFEGLLRGGGGTKVISLGSKASTRVVSTISHADAQRPRSPAPPVPPLPRQTPQTSGITDGAPNTLSPPIVAVAKLSQPYPNAPKSEETHSDSTTSPSAKKPTGRFRITNVISSPNKRLSSVIPPAEYSAVDFETRLASYSDSEGRNSGAGNSDEERKKQKRRESKDDAWVDILVNSHQRRLVGQDVDPTNYKMGGGRGGGDPDLAGLEVAQVLAAVRRDRERSPSVGSDSTGGGGGGDFVPHHDASFGVDMDAHVQGFEIDEIQRVPRRRSEASTSESHALSYDDGDGGYGESGEEYAADDEEHDPDPSQQGHSQSRRPQPIMELTDDIEPVTPVKLTSQQRRMGYFDLHPERKQLYGPDEDTSHGQQDHTPSPDVPSFDLGREQRAAEMERTGLVRADSVTLPSLSSKSSGSQLCSVAGPAASAVKASENGVAVHPVGPRAPAGSSPSSSSPVIGGGTKTAALIEMYRERERKATAAGGNNAPTAPTNVTISSSNSSSPSGPITPPRAAIVVPPRSASLPGATNANANVMVDTPVGAVVEDSAGGGAAAAALETPKSVETGRVSPARYVHGAPLHNVLEEPEDED
jgi:hypothetical protein